MNRALPTASEPLQAAAWIEGFLQGSGLILLHNNSLWHILDNWVMQLREDSFIHFNAFNPSYLCHFFGAGTTTNG